MESIFNRRKDYIVARISNKKVEYVQVRAKNKKEAMTMVTEVLLKCKMFNFNSREQFKLKCKKNKSFKEFISKRIGFFFNERIR